MEALFWFFLLISLGRIATSTVQLVWKTVSGAIASFSDSIGWNLKRLIVNIDPVQDLHGYDNPWPAGGGKNLVYKIIPGATITESGIIKADNTFSLAVAQVTNEETYTFSNDGTALTPNVVGYFATDPVVGSTSYDGNRITSVASTFTASYTGYICLRFATSIDNKLQLEAGSSATSFIPYSNICPITGWTGANVTRTGKNLFDATTYPFTSGYYIDGNSGMAYTLTGVKATLDFIPFDGLDGKTITLNKRPSGNAPGIAFYSSASESGFIDGVRNSGGTASTPITVTVPNGTKYMRFTVADGATDIQIEIGSTATDYEPFSVTTYPITFPSGAGTVYGGTLDVTNGKLRVNMAVVDLGTITWACPTTGSLRASFPNIKSAPSDSTQIKMFCTIYKTITPATWYNNVDIGIASLKSGYVGDHVIGVYDPAYSDPDVFKAAMNGVELVYELATPVEHTLTPTEIKTLLGVNNIWADTGNVEVEYLTKVAIDE